MRLRTFESFWLVKNGIINSYPSLQENLETDIVVVGAGITGALTSHALLEKGYKVVLIDQRDVAMGSTAATTSMLQYEIDVSLTDLSEMIGEYAAATCYQAGVDAIKKMETLIKNTGIDVGFEKKESLYLAHNEKAAADLYKEFDLRNKHQLGVEWLSAAQAFEAYELICCGAILSNTAASVDAYKMAHALIQLNLKRGMKVYDQTEIKHFNLTEQPAVVTSSEGFEVRCKKVIFCSGFESTQMLKEKIANLFYTYACVSEQAIQLPKKLKDVLVWDTDHPYLYMRTTDDGRLLVGGEDASVNFPFFQQKIKENKAESSKKN